MAGGGGGLGGGRNLGSIRQPGFLLEALDKSQSKRDGGFKNNWSFDHSEESEGDTEKDEANLLTFDESDGTCSPNGERKPYHHRLVGFGARNDALRTYSRRNKSDTPGTLKSTPTGLNISGSSKKICVNAENISYSESEVQARHLSAHTQTRVKTAAQKKEYPHNIPKVDNNCNKWSQLQEMKRVMENRDESGSESESGITRRVQQKRQCSLYQAGLLPSPATKTNATHIEGLDSCSRICPCIGKTNEKVMVRRNIGPAMLRPNGKVGSKMTGHLRQKTTTTSELNDPIVLSSDDEEDQIGVTNRMESVSPRPADSACSSPAPSTGKVEAALKENTCELEQRLTGITAETEATVALPRKARMKDQFGNIVSNAPVKRRKVFPQETVTDVIIPSKYQNSYESVILNCRSIRIGTLRRMVVDPVVFCLDYIEIHLEESENDTRDINLKTSDLTKCEWCGVRKLPVVFLQTVPAACQSLRSQLKMNREKDNVWYDCKGANPEEQYIILIFETGLDPHANAIFEKIITEIGIRNNISDFFVKITFEEANSRLVAFTKSFEDTSRGSSGPKESKTKHVLEFSDSKMQLQNATQFQFFEDDESGEPHTVFIGPIEKLIVYPPPPAKGGISVTNEDLHCLNEGEFLNDVIIDFYLKYLVLEKLKQEDADRIHVFSSFFYKRLNQRERRNLQETSKLTIQQKRHGRVKTWTRHVDIFEKDFIFVPLNEAAHWFLAVICFPEANGMQNEHKIHIQASDGLQKIRLNCTENSADSNKLNEDELIDFSEDQDNQDNSSDDDGLADDNCNSELGQWHLKPTICKQPCILLMDSLRGPSRSNVVRTLREYLEVEWEVRKGSRRSFSRDVMKGSNPKVPQQNNFSDCGVYVLQYVESFFETPILSFELPMNLTDWFPRPRMKTKREEIKNIILNLQEQQNKEKKGQKDTNLTDKYFQERTEQFISS
ncbi:sentrin-specific protease 6 [Crotalus adamanteus]|uniref:Sentrin-specific protease 6 n=1 Tax=Crotalus adamanteus TaxID=8729 RepID=A0AAW1CB18_CROAD